MNQATNNMITALRDAISRDTYNVVNFILEELYHTENKIAAMDLVAEYFNRHRTKINYDALRIMAVLFANEPKYTRVYAAICANINKRMQY